MTLATGTAGVNRYIRNTSRASSTSSPLRTPSLPPTSALRRCGPPAISTMNGQRRLLGSFNHGSMANAMPQAIGAQLAFPRRQVISLSGDGGFSMLMGDFLTIRQLKLPVKIVVFNNGALGFVELEMKAAGLLEYGTTLDNPDFAQMAEAIGIRGIRVEDPAEVEPAIREALAHRRSSANRCRSQSTGAFNAAEDPTGAGHGVQPLHAEGRDQREGGRNLRSRKDQPLAIILSPLH